MAVAASVLALLPVFVLLVTRAGRDYLPHGDIAIIDLRVRDLVAGDFPLLGAYSRYGWNHPGPMFFFVLAPLSALAGGAAWATMVGGALLQAVAIALSARLAWRRGGLLLLLLVLAAITLATHAIGARILLDAWNPHVAVPFLALFVLQVWSVTLGDRWQLVGAAVVGTFLVQTHVGYIPLVAAGAAYAVVLTVVDQRRHKKMWAPWRRPAIVAAAVGVVLWIPTVVEELTTDPGNLTRLARYARSSADAGVGFADGAGLLAAEFRIPPPWLGGDDLTEAFTNAARPASVWWLVVPVVLLVVSAVAARRGSARESGRLVGLVALLSAVGVAALSNVESPTNDYLFHWRVVLATLIVAAVAWAVAGGADGSTGRGRAVMAVAAIALGFGGGAQAWDVADHSGPINLDEPASRQLLRQLDADTIPDEPFLTRNIGSAYRGIHAALVDELDRRGEPIRVDSELDYVYGDDHTVPADESGVVWYVAEEGIDVSHYTARRGARVVARTSPLDDTEEQELVELQRSLARQLRDADRPDLVGFLEYDGLVRVAKDVSGVDDADAERAAVLVEKVARRGGCRCAVIAFAPNDAPPFDAAPYR